MALRMEMRPAGRLFGVMALGILLSACASVGNAKLEDVDEPYVKQALSRGEGTKQGMVDLFGQPQRKISFDGDNEIWVYSYRQYKAKLQNLTNVSVLFRGQNNYSKELVLLFDKSGKVRQWKLSASEESVGTGFATQRLPAEN
ncbi:Lipoprotein SmpA/OmlA domain-containing protein [Chromobacterium violaceum]|uniref:Lipoprotein SmpA/OmlA domain-containing protein n=1 Tax=Chromobacterium violaceum TaxID=536 RepID=A0A3S4J289_CHRVL|nr:hypothetical protein [Chromobacterium violaceum]ATP29171.1 hypothetical protein CRN81_12595 [Chromobacterium violaceum]ATP33080.1 hypothetical protein CR207_12615 [Chromobacterium violaceum]MBT2869129.1 hypothetical protein [Chromobacterium violaceum]MCD0491815.1 hypothetical protein [Chromobacterium violaceum]QIY81059.1 hypothetical protein FOB43_18630 [Chromobacterium violaceum]